MSRKRFFYEVNAPHRQYVCGICEEHVKVRLITLCDASGISRVWPMAFFAGCRDEVCIRCHDTYLGPEGEMAMLYPTIPGINYYRQPTVIRDAPVTKKLL